MNLSDFNAPKSDQINADDLMGGPRTITIARVSANEGTPEQPVNVFFDGDGGKPYRPGKSMRRVMVAAWGADTSVYIGRSMTLYRDPKVKFGGLEVGGIRISHMTDIDRDMVIALTETRASRKPFQVRKMAAPPKSADAPPTDAAKPARDPAKIAASLIAKVGTATTKDELDGIVGGARFDEAWAWLTANAPAEETKVKVAVEAARERLDPEPKDDADAAFEETFLGT